MRVKDIAPEEMGGRTPVIEVPYLERDKEPEVARLLADCKPVLVIGRAMAGKSRMCANILHAHYADRRLVRTVDQHFSEELEETPPSAAAVWLDDLDKYLNQGSLRRDWLDRLTGGGNVVLATMRTSEWERYNGQDQIKLPHADAIGKFHVVTLLSSDEVERERLASQMPDQVSAARVQRYGLGEYLGGAPVYEARFEAARDSQPRGVALVRAAAALRRAGLDPVDREFLEGVREHYLSAGTIAGPADEAWEWAMRPVESLPGFLETTDPDAPNEAPVRASDYISDHLPDRGLSEPVWGLVAERVAIDGGVERFGRYAVVWGQTELAVGILESEMGRRHGELGGEHRRTLSVRDSLANAYWKSGDYGRAVTLAQP